jgi:hypothetical protein
MCPHENFETPPMSNIETLEYPFAATSPWYAVAWLARATRTDSVKLQHFADHEKLGEVGWFIVPPVSKPIKCVRRAHVEAFFGPLTQAQIDHANATWRKQHQPQEGLEHDGVPH